MSAHFLSARLPQEVARAQPEALSNAHIVAARMHLRSSRYLAATKHMKRAFALHPRSYLRLRTWQLLAERTAHRIAYKILWQFRRAFPGG